MKSETLHPQCLFSLPRIHGGYSAHIIGCFRFFFIAYIADNFMTQNFNNDLMRQMQQQLATATQTNPSSAAGMANAGAAALGNINANVLMSALSAPQAQPQNGFAALGAENLLAAALAAAGSNSATPQPPSQAPQPPPPQPPIKLPLRILRSC